MAAAECNDGTEHFVNRLPIIVASRKSPDKPKQPSIFPATTQNANLGNSQRHLKSEQRNREEAEQTF
uniref:Uncharacterized protein n=1 Tax=Romanomermis culicivorax TaxID=13658 RepID=A0A915HLJ9_ROMCU